MDIGIETMRQEEESYSHSGHALERGFYMREITNQETGCSKLASIMQGLGANCRIS